MNGQEQSAVERRSSGARRAVWGGAVALLLIPAIGMLVSDEMNWGPGDFAMFAAMLLVACTSWEIARKLTRNRVYQAVAGAAIVATFALIWVELAVGIVGPG